MNALDLANKFEADFNLAKANLNGFLLPFLRQYADLLVELSPDYDKRDLRTETMLYKETEGHAFYFEAEDVYEYGEDYTPSLTMPFAFIEDPEGYSNMRRTHAAEEISRRAAKKKADALKRVTILEAQLNIAKKKAALVLLEVDKP